MLLGLSLSAFVKLHVLISLIGIASGLWFLFGLLGGRWRSGTNRLFLATTRHHHPHDGHWVHAALHHRHACGVVRDHLDGGALAVVLVALYRFRLAGGWRAAYLVSALLALHLNLIVQIVQSFLKISALNRFAPTGTEPPFVAAQNTLLILFLAGAIRATRQRAA